ncbi:MAG: hypothetical protein Q9168_002910 [Polycauliona sp. 1 TL-2023]
MPTKSHTSRSSSKSHNPRKHHTTPIKDYESHLIFKSRATKTEGGAIIQHQDRTIKLLASSSEPTESNSTTNTEIPSLFSGSTDPTPATQLEAEAISAAYAKPASDSVKSWEDITRELNHSRRMDAKKMKEEYPRFLNEEEVKIDFARTFDKLLRKNSKASSGLRLSGRHHSSEGRERSGSERHGGASGSGSREKMYVDEGRKKYSDMTTMERVRRSMNGRS